MPKAVDFMGKDIRLGDIIVYPVRRKSEMILKKAVVSDIPFKANYMLLCGITAINDKGVKIIVRSPDRCVVVGNIMELK